MDANITVRRWLSIARHLPGWNPEVGGAITRQMKLPEQVQVRRLSQGQRLRLGCAKCCFA